jgi:CRP/FNR family cyclic AMP-dependent transcriptional regulator
MAKNRKRDASLTSFLKHAGTGKTVRNYRNNEVIYLKGSPADSVFYLQKGIVKLTAASKRKKAVVTLLQAGDIFGEGCLGQERLQMFNATSIGPSTIMRVEKKVFRDKLERDQAFAAMFIEQLISKIARCQADLEDHFLNFSERRLARILLLHRGIAHKPFTRAFSQTTLAEMVGTTRSRVSRFMSDFKKKGLVSYNGGLEIDSAGLLAFLQR